MAVILGVVGLVLIVWIGAFLMVTSKGQIRPLLIPVLKGILIETTQPLRVTKPTEDQVGKTVFDSLTKYTGQTELFELEAAQDDDLIEFNRSTRFVLENGIEQKTGAGWTVRYLLTAAGKEGKQSVLYYYVVTDPLLSKDELLNFENIWPFKKNENSGGESLGEKKSLPALTQTEARTLATKLAKEDFDTKGFKDSLGNLVPSAHFFDSWSKEGLQKGHWVFELHGNDGPEGAVTFEVDGSHPRVDLKFGDD